MNAIVILILLEGVKKMISTKIMIRCVVIATLAIGLLLIGTITPEDAISKDRLLDIFTPEGRNAELIRLYKELEKRKDSWKRTDAKINATAVQVHIIQILESREYYVLPDIQE